MSIFIVEWSKEWGEPIAVHPWDEWIKIPVGKRNFFSESIEARDELDAYIKARGANQ